MRRSAALVLLATVVAACGGGDSPAIEAGGVEVTSTTSGATTTSTSVTTAPAQAQAIELQLTGDTEVPGPGSDGTAQATLTYDGDQLCLTGTSEGVGAITNGHVHAGVAGESGPVVIDLGIRTDGDGPFEGCATVGAEGGVVLVDPSSYYVNLHTADFPDGAVRAQLA
jgi:hypothetical protein